MRKIVVITPVKNEEWILERFLAVSSTFADLIIVADQQSTDRSREICRRFSKVCVIENPSTDYDEQNRQKLLIDEARRQVAGERFLLALDADEILTADSLHAASWARVQTEAPGVVVSYEKPDIGFPPSLCRRSASFFPLGYVDDGAEHAGDVIHSTRLPVGRTSTCVEIPDIKFAHLAYVRPEEFWARQRFYSVIECAKRTKTLRQRIGYYSPRIHREAIVKTLTPTPESWLGGWRSQGIDFREFPSTKLNHYNWRILREMAEHGPRKFRYDDIWETDWEKLRRAFDAAGNPAYPSHLPAIELPSISSRAVTCGLALMTQKLRALRRRH